MKSVLFSVIVSLFCLCQAGAQLPAADAIKVSKGLLSVQPVKHASMVLSWQGKHVYIDAVGDAGLYKDMAAPDIILITHIHGDHFDKKCLAAINTHNAIIIAPQSVADSLPAALKKNLVVLKNGEKYTKLNIQVLAVPMYNLPESTDAYHPKGKGNGYVLTIGGKRVYISGDTQGIPEMRDLKNIDVAFVCMNKPYTMDVNEAAAAVLAFKPVIIYPYHYRGQDVEAFKELVNKKDPAIEVRLRNWYTVK